MLLNGIYPPVSKNLIHPLARVRVATAAEFAKRQPAAFIRHKPQVFCECLTRYFGQRNATAPRLTRCDQR